MKEVYNSYSQWIRKQFPYRVQKISIDAGFTCPNRDGKVGRGGCIFCDNNTFNPAYCDRKKTITQQLEEGKQFFSRKYPDMKYLAYFQAYSNTYDTLDVLKRKYEEALAVEDVVGLVIGTRPDCMPDDVLDYLEVLNKQTFLIVEYGIESANDETLQRINRGHSFETARQSVERGEVYAERPYAALYGRDHHDEEGSQAIYGKARVRRLAPGQAAEEDGAASTKTKEKTFVKR